MNLYRRLLKWWKFWATTPQEPICPDCGEPIYSLGPDSPRHRCDFKKLVEKTVLEMKQKGII